MAWGEEHLLVEALHSQWCGLLQQCSAYWNLRIEKTEYSTISQKEKGVGKFRFWQEGSSDNPPSPSLLKSHVVEIRGLQL